MIALLKGILHSATAENCILLVQGVGYELQCSTTTLAELTQGQIQSQIQNQIQSPAPAAASKSEPSITLHVYTHVREDALQLFGFCSSAEKNLFLSLIKVNGIGPKSALQILSGTTPRQLAELIDNEDAKALSKLPKVGKKTAEQMILTLKGKLVHGENPATAPAPVVSSVQVQIRSALVNLGFRSSDVEKVVQGLGELTFEDGLRQGLAALTTV